MECAGALRFAATPDHRPDEVPGSVQECVLQGVWRTLSYMCRCRSVLPWGFRRRKRGIRVEGGDCWKDQLLGAWKTWLKPRLGQRIGPICFGNGRTPLRTPSLSQERNRSLFPLTRTGQQPIPRSGTMALRLSSWRYNHSD